MITDVQRTNPTDIPASSFIPSDSVSKTGGLPGLSVVLIPPTNDKSKKKQSGNVRKILYAKKSLKDWLEELVSSQLD